MRGNPEVVDYLNMLIGGELAARDQYLIHSRMYEDWGLSKIFERIDHEMQEEAQHASQQHAEARAELLSAAAEMQRMNSRGQDAEFSAQLEHAMHAAKTQWASEK